MSKDRQLTSLGAKRRAIEHARGWCLPNAAQQSSDVGLELVSSTLDWSRLHGAPGNSG